MSSLPSSSTADLPRPGCCRAPPLLSPDSKRPA